MYHLTRIRSAAAFALLFGVLPSTALYAEPFAEAVPDRTVSHVGANISSNLLTLVTYSGPNFPAPEEPHSFTIVGISGDPVVNLNLAGDLLTIDPINGSTGVATVHLLATDAGVDMDIFFDVTVTNADPVLSGSGNQIVDEGVVFNLPVSATDGDGGADTLTYSLVSAPPGATINPSSGAFSWTPAEADGPGTYSVTIQVADTAGGTDTDSFDIDVTEVNEAPLLSAIGPQSASEDVLLSFTVTATDADLPANGLTYSLDSGPAGATINPSSGLFEWTPGESDGGTSPTATVRVTDDGAGLLSGTATFTINVAETNTAPAVDFIADQAASEGTLLSFTVTASDTDNPANGLTFSLDSAPAGATINPSSGLFEWTPGESDGGTAPTATVRVTDDGAGLLSGTATFTINVAETNTAPVMDPISDRPASEGALLSFTVTASDTDDPANGLTFSLDSAPAGATIDPGTGLFEWTPGESDGGTAPTATVRVTDDGAGLLSGTATFTINVAETNTAPAVDFIADQSASEDALLSFTVTASDTDDPANGLTFSLDSAPAGATIDPTSGLFEWTPGESDGGTAPTATVRVTDDGAGLLSGTATFTINVSESNVAPVLDPISDQAASEGALLSFTVTATDADLPANGLTFSLDSAPAGATIDPSTGLFEWTPGESDGGTAPTATVRVTDDGAGSLFYTATFTINVAETNVAPTLSPIGAQSVSEDTLLSFTAAAADSDVPANSLTYSLDSGAPAGAAIDPVTGVFNWTPIEAQSPGSYNVTVRVTDDGAPALDAFETLTITVSEVNDPPVLVSGIADQAMDEDDAVLNVEVLASFDDPDLADTPPDVLTPIVLSNTNPGLVTVTPNGSGVDLVLTANQYGTATITVAARDNAGAQAADTFDLVVNSVNDLVQVTGGIANVAANEDVGTISVSLAGAFGDLDLANGGDTHTVTFTSSNTALVSPTNSPLAALTGNMDFSVPINANGTATITVTAEDAAGTQAVETFDIVISEMTDAPVVVGSVADQTVAEDTATVVVSFAGVFDDPDLADGDVLSFSASHDNPSLISGLSISGTNLTLNVPANQNGSANVTLQAEDSTFQTASITFVFDVTPVDDDPFVTSPVADINTYEDDPTVFTIDLANVFDDPDILTNGDSLTFAASDTNPALFATNTLSGTELSLMLAPDQNGSSLFTLTATDSTGRTATETFTFNAAGVNDIPVPSDDFAGPYPEDPGTIVIAVMANDYLAEQPTGISSAGVDGNSESTPTIVLDPLDNPISQPNGTVVVSGSVIEYTPKADFFGTDYFTYRLVDNDGDVSPPATVTISVNMQNDPPVGQQERTFAMYENGVLTIDALNGVMVGAYDVDGALLDGSGNPVGSPMFWTVTNNPSMGTIPYTDPVTGEFTYEPFLNFTGEDTFTYRLFDGTDVSEEYVVRVIVNPIPPPVPPPPPGQVAVNFNVANVPLEQASSVSPNVMVILDDSGSMDWNLSVSGNDENGGMTLDNSAATSGGRRNVTGYLYLYGLPNNVFSATSGNGRILPTEEALAADSDTDNNRYGVWRARNHLYNALYYNPQVRYLPWRGQDLTNSEFTNADWRAVRIDPLDSTRTIDLAVPHEYRSYNVPEWDSTGGTTTVRVENSEAVYIPRYYTTTATPPLDWNDPHTLVEIRAANAPFVGGPAREDCAGDGNPMDCSFAEEIQNFANWFQYYRSREYTTKASVGSVIANVQDIRVGFDTISERRSEPVRDMNELHTEGNKKTLLDDIYRVNSSGGTPLRRSLERAGQTFRCSAGSANCPILPAPDGQCQQNFALLFSDGYWNGNTPFTASGNRDGDNNTVWDGGRYADSVSSTLADVAMYYYENDLQPSLDDVVPLASRDLLGAPSGTFTAAFNTMHQHMKTYTIAFGVTGTVDPSTIPATVTAPFAWPSPLSGSPEKIDDMMHAAVNGRGQFLNARDPVALQEAFEQAFLEFSSAASSTSAAAFNSTSLREGTLLYRGFYDLRNNTGELTATPVDNDGTLQNCTIDPTNCWWASEQLNPVHIVPNNRVIVTSHSTTGDGVPFRQPSLAPEQQLMMSAIEVNYLRGARGDENPTGTLRQRPTTDGLLGDIVNSSPIFVGSPSSINRDQTPYPLTDLYSTFAAGAYSRTPVVYVGANDGMLHGFNATTGREVFAYVPNKIMDTSRRYHNDLEDFTSPFYQHKFYVDLTPSLNDVYMRPNRAATGKSWITLLVGGLGAGGKGYYALNVTDPAVQFSSEVNAAATSVLWEFTDEDDTYPINCPMRSETACPGALLGGGSITDPDGLPVKDLGLALQQPSIVMTNVNDGGDKEWAAIFGNGLNSTAGVAKLYVLLVNRGVDGWQAGDVIKLDTGAGVPTSGPLTGYPNGLGTTTSVDVDLDGTVDLVYGGDRLGNLYRFNIQDPNPGNWTVTRLFTATYDDGGGPVIQPILSKPTVTKHPTEDGFLITFGTGSHVAREDADSEDIQSIYTIWDRVVSSPATALPDSKALRLVEQTITNVVDDSTGTPETRRILSENAVNYTPESGVPGTYGWYIDFDMPRATSTTSGASNLDGSGYAPPAPQFPGEKAIRRMLFRDGVIIATTILPSIGTTSCFGSRPGSIMLIDAATGGNPSFPLIDFNNDGYVDDGDLVDFNGQTYAAGLLFDQDALDGSLVDPSILGGEGDTDFLFISGGNDTTSFRILDPNDNRTGRLSWQELD
ncbi:MAG: PilC/PilY family type IV pilus protein [Pseudomonadales bacterium]